MQFHNAAVDCHPFHLLDAREYVTHDDIPIVPFNEFNEVGKIVLYVFGGITEMLNHTFICLGHYPSGECYTRRFGKVMILLRRHTAATKPC